jgi:4-amino-4-deoxy-L-arabinose transferase-like glycosyltransferase
MASRPCLRRETGLLALVLFLLWFAICGLRPLSVPDEGRYPEVAREMLQSGDYVTPHLNGVAFLDKPILYYWLQTVSFRVLGVNNWSVRLMPVLFGVFGAVLVFMASWQLFNRRAAYLAVAALVCNPLYFGASQYANMDLEVAIWVTATLILFLLGRQQVAGSWLRRCLSWLAYAAMGCGVLTKGLIGAVFPLLAIGVWVIVGWRWRELLHWNLFSGIVIFLLVCLPWYLAVQQQNPEFFHYFFIDQQFERFSSGGFNNAVPFWFYAPVLLAGLLPWSLWLLKALYNQCRCAFGKNAIDNTDVRQLLLLWPALVFIFFSIPQSKIVGYILPVVPPLAMLLGDYLDRKLAQCGDVLGFWLKHLRAVATAGFVVSLLLILVIPQIPRFEKDSALPFVRELNVRMQPGDQMVLYREYAQDLPMYLHNAKPLVVVEDWNNRELMQKDDWHHDLDFGIQQLPASRAWFISEEQFALKLRTVQQTSQGKVYVLANPRQEAALSERYGLHTIAHTSKHVLMVTTL